MGKIEIVEVTIPWRHLASSNTRNTRRGGKAHGWKYKASLDAIHTHALAQVGKTRPRFPESPCRIHVTFFPPDRRRRDVLNYMKVLMDGLEGVVYADDYQVDGAIIQRGAVNKGDPGAHVMIIGEV